VIGDKLKGTKCVCIFPGDKKYKITRLDPLEVEKMSVSDGTSQSGFTLTIKDMKMHGLKDAVLKKTE
jgi:hypothetical protein